MQPCKIYHCSCKFKGEVILYYTLASYTTAVRHGRHIDIDEQLEYILKLEVTISHS